DLKEFTVAGDEELKGVECRPTNVYMFQASEAFILHNIIFYKLLQAMALYWSRKPRGEIPWHKTQCTLSSLQIYLLDIQVYDTTLWWYYIQKKSVSALFVQMFDDMDLPCGVLRVQPKGGHGRHKGYNKESL
ncbi:hypothetical protein BHE74_00038207, partial [Ensete ventricosum]